MLGTIKCPYCGEENIVDYKDINLTGPTIKMCFRHLEEPYTATGCMRHFAFTVELSISAVYKLEKIGGRENEDRN